ncbi:cupredoxin domain-containing protein [Candidatus Tisiphia endosymbiont of Beris chalybata]|uniref:cupredoxin domain-containing protein n=1 Tax=Candidatus Tisiphia endosymbiont of Beris chalybata TaxID=3066262 RepID=UPI00312C95D1
MQMKNIFLFSAISILLLLGIIFIIYNKSNKANTSSEIIEVVTVIKNHRFNPDIIHVPKGKKIRLVVHNQDNTVEEFESNDLHREKIIMPNDSINIILAPLAPGKYEFFGDFNQETAQGALIVN